MVPTVNIKLFVVAPLERRNKVMTELARPTFQRIGVSDYCRFIAMEDIETLLTQVTGLAGHVQPSLLETVAVELGGDLGTL